VPSAPKSPKKCASVECRTANRRSMGCGR
jgi:hypothetical protein